VSESSGQQNLRVAGAAGHAKKLGGGGDPISMKQFADPAEGGSELIGVISGRIFELLK